MEYLDGSSAGRRLVSTYAENIVAVVIDECHVCLEYGPCFRPSYRLVTRIKDLLPSALMLGLTATVCWDEVDCLVDCLGFQYNTSIVNGPTRKTNIRLEIAWKSGLNEVVKEILPNQTVKQICFVNTPSQCDTLFRMLTDAGLQSNQYHGKLDDRGEQQKNWLDSGCTMVASFPKQMKEMDQRIKDWESGPEGMRKLFMAIVDQDLVRVYKLANPNHN